MSGNTREEALVRATNALESFVIEGISTTIPFLAEITRHREFAAGDVDTHFLERMMEEKKARASAGGDSEESSKPIGSGKKAVEKSGAPHEA